MLSWSFSASPAFVSPAFDSPAPDSPAPVSPAFVSPAGGSGAGFQPASVFCSAATASRLRPSSATAAFRSSASSNVFSSASTPFSTSVAAIKASCIRRLLNTQHFLQNLVGNADAAVLRDCFGHLFHHH